MYIREPCADRVSVHALMAEHENQGLSLVPSLRTMIPMHCCSLSQLRRHAGSALSLSLAAIV